MKADESIELRLLSDDDDDVEIEEHLGQVDVFKEESDNQAKRSSYTGLILATISALFFSLCSAIVKYLVSYMHPFELAAFRFIGVLIPSIPILILTNSEIFPRGKRILLIIRSFIGTTGLMLSFYAFRYLPLADASVIVFSVPVFVSIIAWLYLNEPIGIINIITLVLTMFGVILISKPTFIFGTSETIKNSGWGVTAAFGATLFGASACVLLRALKTLHFSVIMTNFGAFAILETFMATAYTNSYCMPKCGLDRVLVVAIGIFSFFGQVLLTMAFQVENAGPVSIARTVDIVFAFLWQMLFFNEIPTYCSLFGAFFVISSVLLISLRKWLITLPKNDSLRVKLNFLLL